MGKKILIIDDDKEILFAMSAICEYEGWIPITAKDVLGGVKKFKDHNPDVVLIDYYLPIMNGLAGVKKIRELDLNVPIIVLTIEEDQRVADKFIASGASDFALKPIKAPDIISRINVHLKLKESIETVNKGFVDYAKGVSPETLQKIKNYMEDENKYLSINAIADETGLAYQTVHRYLQYMLYEGEVDILNEYGKIGRPRKKYKLKIKKSS